MKKIILGIGINAKTLENIQKEFPDGEVVHYSKLEDVPISERNLVMGQVFKITNTKIYEPLFIPKLPKNHITPYKYHR